MKKFGIIALVLAVMLVFVPCVMAYGVKQDICSDWAKLYVHDARSVYDLTPWEAEVQDLTADVSAEQFIDYINRTCDYLKKRYDRYGVASVDTPVFPAFAGKTISRECAALYLVQAAEHFGLPMHMPAVTEFPDISSASAEYADPLDKACRIGLFLGDENGFLHPQDALTREEAIALCIRLIDIAPTYKAQTGRNPLGDGLYRAGNAFQFWIENEAGEVLRVWPKRYDTYHYRYGWGVESTGSAIERIDGRLVLLYHGRFTPDGAYGLYFCDPISGEIYFTLPAGMMWYSLSADGRYMIFWTTRYAGTSVDGAYTVYAVYDLTGTEIVPMGASREALVSAGYLAP